MDRARRYVVPLFGLLSLLVAAPAAAATMQKVNQGDWWAGVSGLPTYVNMYIYVPDKLATKPPVVVVPHHCQGTAQSSYSETSALVTVADTTGFIIIYPEATGENCWDAGSSRSLKHGGSGDTGAVVQMVKYTLSKYAGDAGRVYSVGSSSGGIMTEALIGVYPDVFMAGLSLMGVPCGCWADGYNDITGTGSTAQWSNSCAGGTVTKTAQQWGDLVRSYFPGYTGHRPRLQHWHGTADKTLDYKNLAEDVKEWTNLLGLSQSPAGMDTPQSGTTHQYWKSSCGYTVYETFAESGVGHAINVDGAAAAAYFGLDKASAQDPETAACPDAIPGGGAGGASGSAGAPGTAGRGGGTGGNGGAPGTGGGGPGGRGGSTGGGGSAGRLGEGSGGATGTGGAVVPGTGGADGGGTGGRVGGATGGASATGGNSGSGGSSSGGSSSGGSSSGGSGPAGSGGNNAGQSGGTGTMDAGSTSGCSCAVADSGAGSSFAGVAFLLAALSRRRARGRLAHRGTS